MSHVELSGLDLAQAALLLVIDAALSMAFRLNLERRLLIAAIRMVVQLLLVGLVLKALFAMTSPALTAAVVLVMIGFAGYEVTARLSRRLRGPWSYGIGAGSMLFAGVSVTVLALMTQLRPDPWYDPRYVIPLLGMILGNTMNGVSIALDRLLAGAVRERVAIEARLSLGQGFEQAMQGIVRDAVRAGLIPTINAMSAAGLVFLPGMMTGQILAGIPPIEAVKYQILILFLIAGATGLGVFAGIAAASRRLTDSRQRLRLDRVS